MSRRVFGFCFALLLMLASRTAFSAEVINSYDSDITVAKSGAMTVTETIDVTAEGNQIKRGIFRDFPLTQTDANGRRRSVDFKVVSVKRDGNDEPFHTESITGGIRIYAGSADVMLSYGRHRYQFTYTTDRQIRYFDDHDELYWNVTGNGWIFPIRSATATVNLPSGVSVLDTAFFTGPLGSTATNARVSENGDRPTFSTTTSLGANEGLTIAVKMPKGSIDAPSGGNASRWWWEDHRDYFFGFGGLIVVFLYYTRAWVRVGRDPPRGVIVPRWDAPDGISPALANYIDNKGFSGEGWTALSSSLLNLAVKGYVTLDDLDKKLVVKPTNKSGARFEGGDKVLMDSISTYSPLVIDEAHGTTVQAVGKKFRESIEKEQRGRYYNSNMGYTIGGVAISVLALVGLFAFGSLDPETIALMLIPTAIAVFVSLFVAGFVRSLRRGRSIFAKIFAVIGIAIGVFVGLSVLAAFLVALLTSLAEFHETWLMIPVGGIVFLNILYFFIMGAPTALGAKMMDGIDGLRQYLTLAEKDRMNTAGAPSMSPQHFEKLLPYAVALGVEKPWSKAFDNWLAVAAAGAGAAAYQPLWYSGNYDGNFSDRIGGFSSGMASTIASTIPAPVSSSSSGFGGGGSSGGGGGGGGGGGW